MPKKHEIEKCCAVCLHARILPRDENESMPPLAFFLKSDPKCEEKADLCCPYRKNITPYGRCFRFRFDPLKYRPSPALPLQALSEEDILKD